MKELRQQHHWKLQTPTLLTATKSCFSTETEGMEGLVSFLSHLLKTHLPLTLNISDTLPGLLMFPINLWKHFPFNDSQTAWRCWKKRSELCVLDVLASPHIKKPQREWWEPWPESKPGFVILSVPCLKALRGFVTFIGFKVTQAAWAEFDMKINLLAAVSASLEAFVTSLAPVALTVCQRHLLSSQGCLDKALMKNQIKCPNLYCLHQERCTWAWFSSSPGAWQCCQVISLRYSNCCWAAEKWKKASSLCCTTELKAFSAPKGVAGFPQWWIKQIPALWSCKQELWWDEQVPPVAAQLLLDCSL